MLKRGFFSRLLEKLILVSLADKLVNSVFFLLLHDVMNNAVNSTEIIIFLLADNNFLFFSGKDFLILML